MKLPWMKFSERKLWRSAATVQDLADLMARWLEGDIGSQPGYQPRHGPEPETTDLIETLAACNRSGYLTISSQPGLITEHVQQRAAVEGFTADPQMLRRLTLIAHSYGLQTALHMTWAPDIPAKGYIVTTVDGEPFTDFGRHLQISDLGTIWRGCRRTAINAVAAAYQVTLVDIEYGRTDRLLAVLDEAAGLSGPICSGCGCTEHSPCPGGCAWTPGTLDPLCSTCAHPAPVYLMVDEAAAYLNGPTLAPDHPVRLSVQSLFRQVMERGIPELTEEDKERAYQRFLATLDGRGEDLPESGPEYLDGSDADDFTDADDYDDVENECENCGAPYYHSGCDGPFCTWDCAEVGAEAAAYVPTVDLVKRQLQPQRWGWAVGEEPPF